MCLCALNFIYNYYFTFHVFGNKNNLRIGSLCQNMGYLSSMKLIVLKHGVTSFGERSLWPRSLLLTEVHIMHGSYSNSYFWNFSRSISQTINAWTNPCLVAMPPDRGNISYCVRPKTCLDKLSSDIATKCVRRAVDSPKVLFLSVNISTAEGRKKWR